MKQTAVEWLREKLWKEYGFEFSNNTLEQAKEMEKEQISNAYVYGSSYGIDLKNGLSPNNYYNETFKK